MLVLNDTQCFKTGGHLQDYFICVLFVNTSTKEMVVLYFKHIYELSYLRQIMWI